MPIVQQGSINTTALVVPDLYVQIVAPQNLVLNGVPTNVIGAVGTASWGPVNTPTIVATMADYARAFGPIMARKYDMGTQVATAVQQGASNFRCVRVSDGTDVAASSRLWALGIAGIILTARYTGSLGNSVTVTIGLGSKSGTTKLIVSLAGWGSEVFDNIPGVGGAGTWDAMVTAINSGQSPLRGPSQLVVATRGVSDPNVADVAPATVTLSSGASGVSGTDGVTTITAATLVGVDTVPRTGMYALRNQGVSIGLLADFDTSGSWTTANTFGLAEGIYMILCGPSGDTIANAVSVKASAGLDSYACKMMFGDWVYWNDPANGTLRLVSPQGFAAGRLANLSPEQSSLNKPLYGVVGSQKSGLPGGGLRMQYSAAEMQTLFQAGIDVIANPQPGGNYWGVRLGHNSSSNAAVNGDNYTRLTNYLASTLNAGMGRYVGRLITVDLLRQIKATLMDFLRNMQQQGMLHAGIDGSLPFSVICDATNNPNSRTALGYVQADVQVRYTAINEKFIVNLEGGQTVNVTRQTTPAGPVVN